MIVYNHVCILFPLCFVFSLISLKNYSLFDFRSPERWLVKLKNSQTKTCYRNMWFAITQPFSRNGSQNSPKMTPSRSNQKWSSSSEIRIMLRCQMNAPALQSYHETSFKDNFFVNINSSAKSNQNNNVTNQYTLNPWYRTFHKLTVTDFKKRCTKCFV